MGTLDIVGAPPGRQHRPEIGGVRRDPRIRHTTVAGNDLVPLQVLQKTADIQAELVAEAVEKAFSDDFVRKLTGKMIDGLWSER